ncbi:hypothetical protein BSPP4475_07805 [Brevibacillus aydinogluensis]|jgi:transposase-like protein|uniref:Transposase n=1 Tax=Brevibacillus aydinogluensis TaxID=927786 RepID=A0AA48M945_9BACL|nr:hypothetical protein BSPP4475_07805 [Brevibacillus aydinogluensis]
MKMGNFQPILLGILSLIFTMERLNEEIRLRERVIRMFPTRESIIRLIEALLMEINKKG